MFLLPLVRFVAYKSISRFLLLDFDGSVVQVIYELKAGGVDERRLVGAKLEKLAEGETG